MLTTTTTTALNPMLASAMTAGRSLADFMTPEWVLEPKLDGHRCVVRKAGATIVASSRPRAGAGEGLTRTLPAHLLAALSALPDGSYDGELMAPTGKAWDVVRCDLAARLTLVLFDCVEILGEPLSHLSYSDRRAALALAVEHLGANSPVRMTPNMPVSDAAVSRILAAGGEGAVVKRVGSIYRPGARTGDWVKVVPTRRSTLTITGFGAGSFGPFSVTHLVDADGCATCVKTRDGSVRAVFATDPEGFIGRRVVISYKEKVVGGTYRHPMFDHIAGEAE